MSLFVLSEIKFQVALEDVTDISEKEFVFLVSSSVFSLSLLSLEFECLRFILIRLEESFLPG